MRQTRRRRQISLPSRALSLSLPLPLSGVSVCLSILRKGSHTRRKYHIVSSLLQFILQLQRALPLPTCSFTSKNMAALVNPGVRADLGYQKAPDSIDQFQTVAHVVRTPTGPPFSTAAAVDWPTQQMPSLLFGVNVPPLLPTRYPGKECTRNA